MAQRNKRMCDRWTGRGKSSHLFGSINRQDIKTRQAKVATKTGFYDSDVSGCWFNRHACEDTLQSFWEN